MNNTLFRYKVIVTGRRIRSQDLFKNLPIQYVMAENDEQAFEYARRDLCDTYEHIIPYSVIRENREN